MKRVFTIFVLISLCLVSSSVLAQKYYFYNQKEKKDLELNTQSMLLLYKEEPSDADLQNLGAKQAPQKLPQSYIDGLLQKKLGYKADLYAVEVSLPNAKSEEEYAANYKQCRQSDKLLIAMPYFKFGSVQKARLSNIVYVKLKSEHDMELLHSQAGKAGAVVLEQNRFMPLWFSLANTSNDGFRTLSIANVLQESNLFEFVEPELIAMDKMPEPQIEPIKESGSIKKATSCVNDPDYVSQWNLENTGYFLPWNIPIPAGIDIKVCPAWQYAKGGNVKVAVLSMNFPLPTHPDFQDRILPGYDAATGTTPSRNWDNTAYYGTGMVGIIGAAQNNGIGITGVAPECQLMHISSYDPNPNTTPYYYCNVADGINWAWQTGKADVIYLINRIPYIVPSPLITDAIRQATTLGRDSRGSIIVVQSGYVGQDPYPASLDNVLSVGGIDWEGKRYYECGYGQTLDVVAPTSQICSYDYIDNAHVTSYTNWTNMGAAHVAGVAALMLSVNPGLSLQKVHDIIKSTAQKVGGYTYMPKDYNGTWHTEMGYGLVNVAAAVNSSKTLICDAYNMNDNSTTVAYTTWDNYRTLYKPFAVKNGHTLTITATIRCKPAAKIIVEKGGRLVIDGGILTTCDREIWQGIELHPSYNIYAAGWLDMKNGARIENAEIGVLTQTDMSPLNTFKAGRITAENSIFLNCRTAVNINAYCPSSVPNTSLPCYFYKCTFEQSPSRNFIIMDNNPENAFVKLTFAKDVTFKGCTFRDNSSDYPSGFHGIISNYSKLTVTEYCGTYYSTPQPTCNGVRSVFEDLIWGVYATDANNPANNITIDNTDFYASNRNGVPNIGLYGCTNARITSNKFRQTRKDELIWGQRFGIELGACENYKVEANDLCLDRPTNDGTRTEGLTAIEVANGHAKNEVIYRNTIANYYYGIKVDWQNKFYHPTIYYPQYVNDGLQFQCNTFKDYAAHHMFIIGNNREQGIALSQGTSSEPAGNAFYNYNNVTNIESYNAPFYYNYTNTVPYIPQNISGPAYPYWTYSVNTCPQKLVSGYILIPGFAPVKSFESGTQEWYAKTDGGNTQALLAQTEMAIGKDNGSKIIESLQKSKGFLSNKVLLAVAKNESGFTSEMVRDIMVANPQCTRNQEVMKALKNRIKPLDDKMMAEILAGEKVISAREKLEMEIADNGRKITNAIDDNLRLLSSDSVDRTQEIVEQLNYFPIPEYKYQLAQLYFDKNDMKAYQTTLSELDKLITYDVDKEYFHRWCKLNDDIIHWTKNDKYRLDSLPEKPIQYLIDLVWTEEGRLQAKAASILALNGIYIRPERKREEIIQDDKKIIPDLQANTSETDTEFALHPNPAKQSVTFSYQITQDASQAKVYIYHSSGTLAETINIEPGSNSKSVNTDNLSNGIYYCRFIVDGKTVKTVKLVIAK